MKNLALLALLISLAFVTANAQQTGGAEQPAALRVAHLAQGGPNVDIYIDGTRALQGVEAGTVSSYATFPSGEHQVDVYEEGQGPSEGETGGSTDSQPLTTSSVTLEAGQYYTVLATGAQGQGQTGGSGEEQVSVQLQVLSDDLSSLPPAGNALVRIVHAAPSAPAVNVVAQAQGEGGATGGATGGSTGGASAAATGGAQTGGSGAIQGGTDLASDLSFGSASSYAEAPEGTYQIQVQAADGGSVVINLDGVQLSSGVVYSFFASAPTEDSDASIAVVTSVDALVSQQVQEDQ